MVDKRHVVYDSEDTVGYTCFHCGRDVAGFVVAHYPTGKSTAWLLCPGCGSGSVAVAGTIYPQALVGNPIGGLSDELSQTYDEARRSFSSKSYTACELVCRKILMHVAVDKGAKENLTFVEYMTYLQEQQYITPHSKGWVDLVRKHGNQAAHHIGPPSEERAASTLSFTTQLLRLVYGMEHLQKMFIGDKR